MGFITKRTCEPTKVTKTKLSLCLGFGVFFVASAVLLLALDPILLMAKHYTRVEYGTFVHEILKKETDSLHVSFYLFNVTNADKFQSGEDEKLKVQEVGPFTYQENRTNEDVEIDSEEGVLRYTPHHRVTFLPEESVGHPKDIIVTMPNIPVLAMASLVTKEYGFFGRAGFNLITNQLKSNATVTLTAQDYLLGYDEPLIKLGNQFMPNWISFDKLGLLERLYDKSTILRMEVGSRDEEKFKIKTVNNVGGLDVWGYSESETRTSCNTFNNTYEGLCYPPGVTPDSPMRIYRSVLCRFMELEYQRPITMDFGVKGLVYKISNNSYAISEENQCLCNKGICQEGVSDMSPCMYELPVVLSNAHFYNTDPSIYEKVEGLRPNEQDHGSKFVIEPMLGMVMSTKFSVQVNIFMRDVSFNSKVSQFSDMIVPLAYIQIVQPTLPEEVISTLRVIHYVHGPRILLAIEILLLTIGLILLSHSGRLLYWNWIYDKKKGIALNLQNVIKEVAKEPLMTK